MASEADKAEQRVREQRRLIEQKLARLETRVKDDLSTAQTAARERTSDVGQSIPGRHQLEDQVERRPLTAMAAGLAAGIGLGMLSDSISLRGDSPRGKRDRHERDSRDEGRNDGSGMMSWLSGPATAAIIGPVQNQVEEFVASALSGLSGRGSRDESRAQPARTAAEQRSASGESSPEVRR